MVSDGLLHVIIEAAAEYDLPPENVLAVVLQESGGKPNAKRYEPGFFEHYIVPLGVDDPEEAKGLATSWGEMQVMGQVAREMGYTGPFQTILDDHTLAINLGCRHLAAKYKRYFRRYGWDGVFAAYNGGSVRFDFEGKFVNQRYVDEVNEKLEIAKQHFD